MRPDLAHGQIMVTRLNQVYLSSYVNILVSRMTKPCFNHLRVNLNLVLCALIKPVEENGNVSSEATSIQVGT